MGFFSDLAMGFGAKPKTKDYIARTARTIALNEGKKNASESGRARRYQAQYGVTAADIDTNFDEAVKKTRPKDTQLSNIKTVPAKAIPSGKGLTAGQKAGKQYAESMKKANELAKAGKLRRPGTTKTTFDGPYQSTTKVPGKLLSDARPIRNLGGSSLLLDREEAKAAGANIGTGFDPKTGTGYTDTAGQDLTTGPSKYGLQNTLIGKGISYLAGVRGDDKIVNTVGGKPIFQRADGSFYAFDAVGLPYDIADPEVGTAPSTLDIDPEVRERMMRQQQFPSTDDDRPVATEVVGKQPDDPCPKGYMMDPETKECVLDPFKQPFPDKDIGIPTPVPVTNLSPYTQMAPVTLGQLQPTRVAAANPLAMQQANMPPQGGLGSLAPVLNRVS
tara:strand:- start:359 stop:1522 length:1164 start_codon:yes stop_codon:yes gene_type:complete